MGTSGWVLLPLSKSMYLLKKNGNMNHLGLLTITLSDRQY